MTTSDHQGSVLLISGPSGCGKSTICKQLLEYDQVVFSVSATTRAPRPGEVDGTHYHFLSVDQFKARIEAGRGPRKHVRHPPGPHA